MRRTTLALALLVSACQTSPNTPLRPEAVGDGPVTFNKQVVRVFQRNCQTCHRYVYKRPVPLPAGTRIEAECVYDNSAANLKNPSKPPRIVFSGFETTDEMCLASVLGTARMVRR